MPTNFINHAEEIYTAAKLESEFAVERLLAQEYCCLDEFFLGARSTAAGRLAAENHVNAALLLLRKGAQVKYIAQGAGFANNLDLAFLLIESYQASPTDVFWGAIANNHLEFAKVLSGRYPIPPHTSAYAFASVGNRRHADEACLKLSITSDTITTLGKYAAFSGNTDYTEFFLARGADPIAVSEGAAMAGNSEYNETLRKRGNFDISNTARAAAYGGYFAYAEALRAQGADPKKIAMGAAAGGHKEYAEFLRRECSVSATDVAMGAAFGGQQAYAEFLRKNCNANTCDIAEAAKEGGFSKYYNFLTSLRFGTTHPMMYPSSFITSMTRAIRQPTENIFGTIFGSFYNYRR